MAPMRRAVKPLLALVLAFPLALSAVQARDCISEPTCTIAAPCPYSSSASWTDASCGAGRIPVSGVDRVSIVPDTAIVYDMTGQALASSQLDPGLEVFGTFIFDPGPANRDANGYRVLQIQPGPSSLGITIYNGGRMIGGPGAVIVADIRTGSLGLSVHNGGSLEMQGQVVEDTIAALTTENATDALCGPSSVGQQWRITPAGGTAQARIGGRIRFGTGSPAANRQLEIVAVSGGVITVCTHLGDNTSLGPRLTPHATYQGVRALPATRHSTPALIPSSKCLAPGIPEDGCTGAGQGTIVQALPRVGDPIQIISDWQFKKLRVSGNYPDNRDCVANNNPWLCCDAASPNPVNHCEIGIFGENSSDGNAPLPVLQAGTVQGAVSYGALTSATTWPDFSDMNITDADYLGSLNLVGVQDMDVVRNVVHDDDSGAQSAQCGMYLQHCTAAAENECGIGSSGLEAWGPSDMKVEGNAVYRTQGLAICPGTFGAPTAGATNIVVDRNLVFGGCLTASQECGGIELQGIIEPEVTSNIVYDNRNGSSTEVSANAINFPGPVTGVGGFAAYNWMVNNSGACIVGSPAPNAGRPIAVGNYCSNVTANGMQFVAAIGNVIKEYGLRTSGALPGGPAGLADPMAPVEGNYILGNTASGRASPDCSGLLCSRSGITLSRRAPLDDGLAWTSSDNIIVGIGGGTSGPSGAFYLDGADQPDYGITIDHTTFDGRAADSDKSLLYTNVDAGAPAVALRDNFWFSLNGANGIECFGTPNGAIALGVSWSASTGVAAESGGPISPACTNLTGSLTRPASIDLVDPAADNYALVVGSTANTAGAAPPGSAVGSRAFAFDTARIGLPWGDILPFDAPMPVPFGNGTTSNVDTDDDGVMDLHDNCDAIPNPSQRDANGNGLGDACECGPGDTVPGEATDLLVSPTGLGAGALLTWIPPAPVGLLNAMTYDVLRSTVPSAFTAADACFESGGGDTSAIDSTAPPVGSAFFYVVRARNACGPGVAHRNSMGAAVPARDCP